MRRKVLEMYFRGEFDVQPFTVMEANLMPRVLQILSRSPRRCYACYGCKPRKEQLDSFYRLIRNCHEQLFSFPSPLQVIEAKIAALEAMNASLMRREVEELRRDRDSATNKRAKTNLE